MNERDLQHWTWELASHTWSTKSGHHLTEHDKEQKPIKRGLGLYHPRTMIGLDDNELRELTLLLDHYRAAKTLAPTFQWPTLDQIRDWMISNGWLMSGLVDSTDHIVHPVDLARHQPVPKTARQLATHKPSGLHCIMGMPEDVVQTLTYVHQNERDAVTLARAILAHAAEIERRREVAP